MAYTSVDQVVSEPIFRTFEAQSGVAVHAVFDTEETKSTGVLNRLLAEAQSPRADVFWSGDPVRPFILIARGLVEPYVSPNAAGIPAPFKAPGGAWTGFAARARILLVNTRRVAAADRALDPPADERDPDGDRRDVHGDLRARLVHGRKVFARSTARSHTRRHQRALRVIPGADDFLAVIQWRTGALACPRGACPPLKVDVDFARGRSSLN